MTSQSNGLLDRAPILDEVKMISGRRIEEKRRLRCMTQGRLAARAGIGVRWLREIESGNPKPRFDDHLKCAYALGLSGAHLLIPILFLERQMHFPRHILDDDLHDLGARCIEFIARHNLDNILGSGQGRTWDHRPVDIRGRD